MEKVNIVFDGNYLIHKCFSIWSLYYQDKKLTAEENERLIEMALEDKEKQQVFLRKIIIDMCFAINKFSEKPNNVVVVIDSHSWRYRFHDNYKYALMKVKGCYYSSFLRTIDMIENYLRKRGIIVSRVDGAEGDDLLYFWSLYYSNILKQSCIIVTGDSDIRQIINSKVSIFNNNSKNLHIYCSKDKEEYWKKRVESDITIEPTVPFEVLLYKVVMGDKSDNIQKIKVGIGDVGFRKFIDYISPYKQPRDGVTLINMSRWIAKRFSDFANLDYEDTLKKVIFNLKMVWLNLETYNAVGCSGLLKSMMKNVSVNKMKYKYNRPYTLEYFYGLTIK